MISDGADACGAGAGLGAGLGAGVGAGAGLGATAACDCLLAAGGVEAFELLSLLPPQLATPTAISRIAAVVARKVIGLLRFMLVPSGLGNSQGRWRRTVCRRPPGGTSACNPRGSWGACDPIDSRLALPGGET